MEGNETYAGFESTSFSGDAEVYFNYYTRADLETMFETAGFRIEYFKRQPYTETDGSITNDLIFIATIT